MVHELLDRALRQRRAGIGGGIPEEISHRLARLEQSIGRSIGAIGAGVQIGTGLIVDLAVTATKLAADSVTTVKILDANVTTAKILDANVTTVKILDANVTKAKLSANLNSSILHLGGATADGGVGVGTKYLQHGAATATEADANRWIAPQAGTVDQLRTESKQAAGSTMAFTLRKNAAATTLLIAATAGNAAVQTLNDLVNSFTVAAGDVLDLEVVVATAGGSVKSATARFTPS